MNRLIIAALYLLAGLMLLGFFNSGLALTGPAVVALLLVVVLPAGIATRLLLKQPSAKAVQQRQQDLRMNTIESEILRIARLHQGKLTLVEIVSDLAISTDEAKAAADSLVHKEIADLEITDSGVLVYTFYDLRHLHEKSSARGLLE
ncbi:MAG TPA: hypothetical protein VFO52_06945 [Longimicrobiales bacterium]|nr:hypothetical protein [Longimicrobiales bacterium]